MNTGCTHGCRLVKLIERAQRVQIPCHGLTLDVSVTYIGWAGRAAPDWSRRIPAAPDRGSCTLRPAAMDAFRIDELARRLLERLPPALRSMQADLESNFRAVLRERLSKLDLVTRDEFDAQTRVLERTRTQLEALEARLTALESHSDGAAPTV
jgi:hypothetical protein